MSENEERVERNRGIIEQFRANGGAVPGYEETPLLLLPTTGAWRGGLGREQSASRPSGGERESWRANGVSSP
jgi:hypothetical protein